ncbi:MAG: SpoIIE family protein phosphatase [Actinomycetota bacterium]|nr:SpoIIE family protein phosphatase [Actinomycetota bacterium]
MRDEGALSLVSTELLEQLGDAVTVIDHDWRYTYVSRGAAAVIGEPVEELVGRAVWDVFPQVVGTEEHAAALRAMSERTAVKIVWFFDRVGRWFEQHAIPVPAGLVVVVDDVTDREEDARRADQLLALGQAFAEVLTVDEVTAVTQAQVLPLLGAAGGALVLVDEASACCRSTGWSGVSDGFAQRWARYPMEPATPAVDAYRSGQPVVLESLAEARERYPHLADDLVRIGRHTVVAFPLVAGGRRLGALGANFTDRTLTPRERSFLATVAAMCAQALVRAQQFDAEKRSVDALQRHLLPRSLPVVPGVEIAVRYASSEAGVDIGGDWFDVVPLSGEAVGLVIGDVEGHDVEAAALMGLVRSAMRAYALEGHPPALILDRTNAYLSGLHAERLVTAAYVQVHPAERLVVAASAGHPAPMTVAPGGPVQTLPVDTGPPLGAVPSSLSWPETTSTVAAGSTLVAFTDGLVEERGADLDVGLERVRRALLRSASEGVEQIAADLLAARPAGNRDDIAVLVAHLTAPALDPSQRHVRRLLPPTPASVFIARRFVTQVLHLWAVPDDTLAGVQLVVSELVTNAARHSEDVIEIRLRHSGAVLRVDVLDSSHRMPRTDRHDDVDDEATSGRGLLLVDAVTDRWGVDSAGLGKTVWCEFDVDAIVVGEGAAAPR